DLFNTLFYQSLIRAFVGGTGDRTADLLHAMQALSQLSYSPTSVDGAHVKRESLSCQIYFREI
ncbi:hypothetical protein, partial [Pseudomonas viridiflava]|uniref:hypothetical protein n=1 Tax=Pseudomonas viridiflava TaxID=33069 RepID=UPI00197EDBBD